MQSCEESDFTNPSLAGEELAGFKGFVVKFMIKMSRVSSQSRIIIKIYKLILHVFTMFRIFLHHH